MTRTKQTGRKRTKRTARERHMDDRSAGPPAVPLAMAPSRIKYERNTCSFGPKYSSAEARNEVKIKLEPASTSKPMVKEEEDDYPTLQRGRNLKIESMEGSPLHHVPGATVATPARGLGEAIEYPDSEDNAKLAPSLPYHPIEFFFSAYQNETIGEGWVPSSFSIEVLEQGMHLPTHPQIKTAAYSVMIRSIKAALLLDLDPKSFSTSKFEKTQRFKKI